MAAIKYFNVIRVTVSYLQSNDTNISRCRLSVTFVAQTGDLVCIIHAMSYFLIVSQIGAFKAPVVNELQL